MNRLVEVLRAVVVSPEALWIVAVLWLALVKPAWLVSFGSAFLTLEPVAVPLLGAPFLLLIVIYKLASAVLRPTCEQLALRRWPGYWRLKIRVMVGFAYSVSGAVSVVLGWGLYRVGQKLVGTALTFCGIGVAALVLLTVAYAKHTIDDIIEGFE